MNLASLTDCIAIGLAGVTAGVVVGTLFGHWLAARVMSALHEIESRMVTVERTLGIGATGPVAAPAASAATTSARAAQKK